MKALKTIGNCCLVFLTVIAVCVIIAYVYYHFFVNDKTVGVNYVDNQIGLDIQKSDELTEEEKDEFEERYFIEANFYSNAKNNGIALQEMKLNYFTDYKLLSTSYRSTVYAIFGRFETRRFATCSNDGRTSHPRRAEELYLLRHHERDKLGRRETSHAVKPRNGVYYQYRQQAVSDTIG